MRPYLTAPDGTKRGVNPVTGLLEEGIPNAQVILDAQDGGITLSSPAHGTYQVALSAVAAAEVPVNLSYLSAGQPQEKRVRLFHHGGITTCSYRLAGAAAEPLTVAHLPAAPVNARALAIAGESGAPLGIYTVRALLPDRRRACCRISSRTTTAITMA